jgi:hypothetical protein
MPLPFFVVTLGAANQNTVSVWAKEETASATNARMAVMRNVKRVLEEKVAVLDEAILPFFLSKDNSFKREVKQFPGKKL